MNEITQRAKKKFNVDLKSDKEIFKNLKELPSLVKLLKMIK
jgi:hypothetical protein